MSPQDYTSFQNHLQSIEPLIAKPSLNLEDQATLIENVRQISLMMVDRVHAFRLHKEEAIRMNKALLGYVLSIPRLEEPSDTDMLTRALHQIECINVASLDIQSYLKKHFAELCAYIEDNREQN